MKKSYLFILLCFSGITFAQISITSNTFSYSQDFNTLASSGTTNSLSLSGWAFLETGTGGNTTYAAGTGSSNGGNTWSFGTDASDRAFGAIQSGTVATTIGVSFTNNSGETITSIPVSYTGEMWRLGLASTAEADRLDFLYSTDASSLSTGTWTDVNSLDFSSPVLSGTAGAVNGNNATYRATLSATITGLSLANGSTIWFKWVDFNRTSSDDGLAIDDFYFNQSGDALPVELTSFFSKLSNGKVQLNWSTATEVNNNGFEVERSTDNASWSKISFVKGAGNSNVTRNYSYIDNSVQAGTYYYRLKQIDNDGTFEYNTAIEVKVGSPEIYALDQNYPNPFNPATEISYSVPQTSKVELVVYSITGQLVKTLVNETKEAGYYTASFNGTGLTSGLYVYQLKAGNVVKTRKMMLVK